MTISELNRKYNEKDLVFFATEGNFEATNKRFKINDYVIDNDNILLVTNNIQYFPNKDVFVLWVSCDKVVYLKKWQLKKVYNYENVGDTYIVKLNRNYFKVYNCFKSTEFGGEQEKSFDDLKEIAQSISESTKYWFKETNLYGYDF